MLVNLAALVEIATGLLLLVHPSALAWLLFGTDLTSSQAALALGRLAGCALLSLGWACWPRHSAAGTSGLSALLIYNVLVTILLAYLGRVEGLEGILLWPAVALHVVLATLLARRCLKHAEREPKTPS